MIRITSEPIDLNALYAHLASPRSGALVVFTGHVRDHNEGQRVKGLDYEAYAEMAERQMTLIRDAMHERWPLERVALIHRVGALDVGDVAVAVGISAAHRPAAFEACRYGIDTLKAEVPIWKKEHREAGAQWLQNPEA